MSANILSYLILLLLVFLTIVIVRFMKENTRLLDKRIHRILATIVLIVVLYLVLYTVVTFI